MDLFCFCCRNLTRGGTIMISRDFTLEKKKLYRSYQQDHWNQSFHTPHGSILFRSDMILVIMRKLIVDPIWRFVAACSRSQRWELSVDVFDKREDAKGQSREGERRETADEIGKRRKNFWSSWRAFFSNLQLTPSD